MEKRISDIKKYVQDLLSKGAQPVYYAKTATITARPAVPGEKIITKLSDGHTETENTNINPGDMLIKNPTGELYVIKADVFKARYEKVPNSENLYRPKSLPQKLVRLTEDVVFKAPWGEDQHMRKGDFINITNIDKDIYGIAQKELFNTHTQCTSDGKLLQSFDNGLYR